MNEKRLIINYRWNCSQYRTVGMHSQQCLHGSDRRSRRQTATTTDECRQFS